MLNYTQRLYAVLGRLIALFTVTHQWINSVQRKLARWAWYTDVMSLTAILAFSHTSDEPQEMLQARERERAAGRGSDGQVHSRDASHNSNWQLAGDCSWLRRLTCCHTPSSTLTTTYSGVKWQDIGRSLHGPSSLYRLARVRCEGGEVRLYCICFASKYLRSACHLWWQLLPTQFTPMTRWNCQCSLCWNMWCVLASNCESERPN